MALYITRSPEETRQLGMRLGERLPPGALVAFCGGMGAGKTTFCQGIAMGLGCRDPVSSPTFALVNYYRGPRPFAHFDLYRASSMQDLETAGFFDYVDAGAVVALEWSERLPFGRPDVTVRMRTLAPQEREIQIEGADGI